MSSFSDKTVNWTSPMIELPNPHNQNMIVNETGQLHVLRNSLICYKQQREPVVNPIDFCTFNF